MSNKKTSQEISAKTKSKSKSRATGGRRSPSTKTRPISVKPYFKAGKDLDS